MKNRNKGLRRAAAFILAAVLAGSSVEIPAAADGDTGTGNTGSGTVVVTVFSDLEEGIRTQTLDIGAEKTDITLPETLDVTLEIRSGESGVEAAAVVQEPETQTEPVTQEPVPDNMQTEENTGTQENPDGTQNQTDGPETDQGTENGTEPVTPPAAADTEQTETPGTEDPGTQQTEAPATEAPVQQQEEPAEPSGQEGQSAGAEAPAAETGAAETAAVLQAEPPAEPEAPVTEGQKTPETADTEQTVTETGEDGGILTSLLDAVFPSMTVHAAEATNVQTVENFTLTGITWKINTGGTFQSKTAAKYVYVPELPETVTIDGIDYTLKLGEGVQLPKITVAVAEKTDGYGTIIHEGTTGNCTWTLYDTDGDRTEDLLVIGGTGAMPDYYGSGYIPWNDYRGNIKKVVVEEGITALGFFAFSDCSNLEEVTLPSTLEKIGSYAFASCKSLDTLVIPSGVTEIEESAFSDCSGLVSITLPDTLKNIGQYAFFQCGLVEIEIPEGVETIGDYAFRQCYSLQSVILPDTLISIEQYAFYRDSNLTIIVPESVQTIGDGAFNGVKAVYNLSDYAIDVSSSTTVNYDKITLVENGESSEQRVLPANCVVGSRYAGTRYDASSYYSSGEGNTAWYVKNGETYEKVTSGTSFQNTPTFYYAKAFDGTTVAAEAAGESGDSYTLVVKDTETGEILTEGTHYTQKMTGSTGWAETDTGSLAKTVTVTITGVVGGGYVGTMETTFQISAEAEASVTADGNTTKYPAFEDAWEAAQGKTAEVTLLADVEVSATLTVTSGSNITLKSEKDSNYTISGNVFNSASGLINVATGGTLTLENGTIKNGAGGNNAIAVNGGRFVLNGGTAAATADGHSGVCVYNRGTAEIQSGNVSGDIGVAAASDGSTIAISDGNISGRASGVYVSGSGAKITITGGSISASNTKGENGADGTALRIQSSGSALLSGGSYSGAYGILIDSGNSITLKELLNVGGDLKYAYYSSNGVLVTEGLDGKTLTGSLTVEKCGHSYKTWTDTEDGENHIGTCVVCGHEETPPMTGTQTENVKQKAVMRRRQPA